MRDAAQVFLLSPAYCAGRRAAILLRPGATSDLATRLRSGTLTLGEAFAFLSGLYFRGKLAYAERFAPGHAYVITPCLGLLDPRTRVGQREFEQLARVPIDPAEPRYVEPLLRDIIRLAGDHDGPVVLLGSVASPKYTQPLLDVLGSRLVFPATFVGRGDMSRGGVLLRAARVGEELDYIPVAGAQLRGTRPPKLPPVR